MPKGGIFETYDPSKRNTAHLQSDVLLALFHTLYCAFGFQSLEREKLHQAFPFFLAFYCALGGNVRGLHFYRDITSGRFRDIDKAISDLHIYGMIEYHSGDIKDLIYFRLADPRMKERLMRNPEFDLVQKAAASFSAAYRHEAKWEDLGF
ncbi:MAG TPA: hypothetical protein VJC12_02080 [Candidatus Paceibacterota bacterium]